MTKQFPIFLIILLTVFQSACVAPKTQLIKPENYPKDSNDFYKVQPHLKHNGHCIELSPLAAQVKQYRYYTFYDPKDWLIYLQQPQHCGDNKIVLTQLNTRKSRSTLKVMNASAQVQCANGIKVLDSEKSLTIDEQNLSGYHKSIEAKAMAFVRLFILIVNDLKYQAYDLCRSNQ